MVLEFDPFFSGKKAKPKQTSKRPHMHFNPIFHESYIYLFLKQDQVVFFPDKPYLIQPQQLLHAWKTREGMIALARYKCPGGPLLSPPFLLSFPPSPFTIMEL